VPAEASGVFATRVDVPAFRSQMLRAFGWDGPNKLAEVEVAHGFDLDEDLLDPLDGLVLAYVLPPATVGVPNATLVFDLEDPVAFERGLIGLFAAANASRIEVRSSKYRAIPMWTVAADREGSLGPFQVSPSVAIVGKRALVTTTASWMRKEIKRLSDPSNITAASTEPPAAGSGWVPPTNFPAEATWLGSMDWASTISALYKVGRAALALGGMIDLPFDLAKVSAALPDTSDPFTRYVRPTIGWGRRIEGGIHTRIESSFGPETWISFAGLAASAPRWMATMGAPTTPESDTGAGQSSEAKASAQELDETLVTLGFLSSRLAVYRIEHKRFPTELSDLCVPTASFPRGFVNGDALPADGWKRGFVYDVTPAGDSYRLWSIGPDGVDGRGSGDDVVAH
jgi:hypothetical protein